MERKHRPRFVSSRLLLYNVNVSFVHRSLMIIISVFLQNEVYIIMLYNHSLPAAEKTLSMELKFSPPDVNTAFALFALSYCVGD